MALNITFYDGIRYHRFDFINRDKDFFGNGVVNSTDFPYTFPGGMQISLGAGTAWVDGYRINNDSSSNQVLTVPAADTTNPRIDIVQIGHDDVNNVASLVIKEGVASSNPVEPNADPNYLKLFAISVPANTTSISSSNVTDKRNLVPLNVSGAQINMAGAAGTAQQNTFTQSNKFTASISSIMATQIVLGQTNNVSGAASTIYLASAAANGMGMDQYGNLLPIAPSSIASGNSWSVLGKGGNKDFQVFVDGTHKITSYKNTLDDGSGNMTLAGSIKSVKNTLDDGAGNVTITGFLKSVKNTLDDGAGNMVVNGSFTASGASTFKAMNMAPSGTATSSSNATSSVLSWQNSTWNGSAAVTNIRNMVLDSDNGWKLTNVGASSYVFSVDNAGKGTFSGGLISGKNTLDDGSGNMTIAGSLTAAGQSTIAGVQISQYGIRNVQASDTRGNFDIPFQAGQQKSLSLDFKLLGAAGAIPGTTYAGVVTVAPWTDGSGGYPHQLGFSDNGEIYHRQGVTGAKTAWAASTAYAVNNTVQPKTNNGHYYVATVAGTSGTTEPTWPTASGATVTDGGVTWKESGTFWNGWTRLIDDDGSGNVNITGNTNINSQQSINIGKASGAYQSGAIYIGNATGKGDTQIATTNAGASGVVGEILGIAQYGVKWLLALNSSGTLGITGGLYTGKNTLDDGSGNITLAGDITGSASNFHIRPKAGGSVGFTNNAGSQYGLSVNDSATPSAYTFKNTLDDGTGSMTIAGSLVATAASAGIELGSSSSTGTPYIDFHSSGSANDYDVRLIATNGTAGTVGKGTLAIHAGNVQTDHNTLDDGSGNATFAGILNALDGGKIGNSTNGYLRIATGSGGVFLEAYNGAGNGSTTLNLAGYSGAATTVKTVNNTLDDGNGNMTIKAALAVAGNSGTATLDSSGARMTFSRGSSNYIEASTAGGQLVFATNGNGDASPDLRLNNHVVTTFNNTLDDGKGNLGLGITPTYGLHQLGGAAKIQALATPNTPSVTNVGTAGTTLYNYAVIAVDRNGNRTLASSFGSTTTGNATLSSTNYNTISWTAVPGAVSYDILKGGSTTALATGVTGTSINDVGQATSSYSAPGRNNTGDLTVDGQISVGGYNAWSEDYTKRSHVFSFTSTSVSLTANTYVKVLFDSPVNDILGEFASSRFTAKNSGVYNISPNVFISANTSAFGAYMYVYKNGSLYARLYGGTVQTGNAALLNGSTNLLLNAGDYIEIFCYCTVAQTTQTGSNNTSIAITRIS